MLTKQTVEYVYNTQFCTSAENPCLNSIEIKKSSERKCHLLQSHAKVNTMWKMMIQGKVNMTTY